jgi:hypothetical protein
MTLDTQFESGSRDTGPSLFRSLTQPTARELWLLIGLGLTVLVVSAVYALQWSDGQRERVSAAQAELMLAHQAHVLARRSDMSAADHAQLGALSAWSVHGETLWLARLKIEQQLHAAAVQAGLPSTDISVGEALEDNAAMPVLRAEISGPYVRASWLRYLDRLASLPAALVIRKLDVSDAETAQFRLVLLFPVTIDQGQTLPAETTP